MDSGDKVYVITHRWSEVKAIFIDKKDAENYLKKRGNKEYLVLKEHRIIKPKKEIQI